MEHMTRKPSILISYVYFEKFLPLLNRCDLYTEWVIDSGAFSAFSLKIEIKLQDYIDRVKRLRDTPNPPLEVFGLDVIGDWKAGLRNVEEMWRQGIEAVPTFHAGEPEDVLKGIAKDYPKIALGGSARRMKGNLRFNYLQECFNRVYPKRIHGFGVGKEDYVLRLPFETTDATTWMLSPSAFGSWLQYGRKPGIRLVGDRMNLVALNADYIMTIQDRMRSKWAAEMKRIGAK